MFLGLLECLQCSKKYTAKSSLVRHVKFECGKEPAFKCPYCSVATKQKPPLIRHVRHKHPDLSEAFLKTFYERPRHTFRIQYYKAT